MESFISFLEFGLWSVFDINKPIHLLFLLSLMAPFQIIQYGRMFRLLTVFSCGLLLMYFLSSFEVFVVQDNLINLLSPISVLFLSLLCISALKRPGGLGVAALFFAGIFGFIHGLLLSSYAIAHSVSAEAVSLVGFAFGVLLAFVLFSLIYFLISTILFQLFRFKHRDWILAVESLCLGASLILLLQSGWI